MVHIPFLKIDVPDPDISALIPATISLAVNFVAAIHDAIDNFLHPLSPDARELYERKCISALPKEFRKARKRIKERRIVDPDKQSSELEEAGFAYYRRMIRTNWVGYTDEDMEDATFRRLVTAGRPGEELQRAFDAATLEAALEEGLPSQMVVGDSAAVVAAGAAAATLGHEMGEQHQELQQQAQDAATAAGTSRAQRCRAAPGQVSLPGCAQRVVLTSATSGAGLALGVGVVRLVALLAKVRAGGKRRSGKRGGAAAKGGHRRVSAASSGRGRNSAGGGASGSAPSHSGAARK